MLKYTKYARYIPRIEYPDPIYPIFSVMCTYSGINWLPVAISPMLQTILRNDLDFDGFVISDYDELHRIK